MSFRAFDLLTLANDFGEPLTLRQISTAGTYNPTTGSVNNSATTDYSFTGYFYNYAYENPSEIVRGSRKCVIPALGLAVDPFPDDLIIGSNNTVKVTRAVSIFSNGVAICYLCDVQE